MSTIWYFENVNLYSVLCPHKIKRFSKQHAFKKFSKGDFIYFKEEYSRHIYLVSEGKVKITTYTEDGEEMIKAILTKGEIFGEMALLGEKKRKDFAQSVSANTCICPMEVDQMYDLMRENQQFGLAIHKIIGLRIRKLERRLELLFFKDVKTRLLDFIKELAQEQPNSQKAEQIEIPLVYTHKDIADLIGSRRATVTSMLNELKEAGYIDYSRKSIHILDKSFLKEGAQVS
ncbi:Crp/Fnr family transcriptional regulator [Chondrinema litorale]|uniref:Crp/Fnr family transcriptional regulator n=1 Tax=Chondrinema litorale TaxID=2994555 RepID=UPI002543CC69|nr:Crp/Fnr family transcriptional regulator [Chondrinema litorale]UZR93063.1 Crp/Fnr family transcriptional regulator [Chondrinema litorale]